MNTFFIHNVKYFPTLVLALLLGACGGGTQVADVGTSGTGIVASGTITGFGSVFVNGVKFSTSSSTAISDDGANKAESELKIGQVVEIKGTTTSAGNADASSIAVNKELKGPVDVAYSATAKTFGVLGQTVIADDNTLIDDNLNLGTAGLAALAVGTQVEVSGFRQPDGRIRATRIEAQVSAARQYKLRGSISDLNSTVPSFKIGAITVNYPGINIQNLPSGGLVAGLQVEVRAATAPANNAITATRIEVKGGVSGRSGDKAEVEGLIANFSGCTFSVNGQAVDACGNVEFEDGVRADLADGRRIEAEGQLASGGTLVASKVEFKSSSGSGGGSGGDTSTFVRVNAQVQSAPSQSGRSITVLGKTFIVSASTQFEDKVSDTRPFNIDNFASVIKAGDIVEIRGIADSSGQLNATLVERNDDSDIIIQGRLEQNNATLLTIQGVSVRVGLSTQFKDASDNTITRLQFDAAVSVGAKVKAKGSNLGASDNSVDATNGEVEIET